MKKTIVTVVIELDSEYEKDSVEHIIHNTLRGKDTLHEGEAYNIVDIEEIEE